MNRPKNIVNKLFLAIAVLAALPLIQSCITDDLSQCNVGGDDPSHQSVKGNLVYAAFNVNNLNSGSTRLAEDNTHDVHGDPEEYLLIKDFPESEVHHVLLMFDKDGGLITYEDPETEEIVYMYPLTFTPKENPGEGEEEEEEEGEEENPEDPEPNPDEGDSGNDGDDTGSGDDTDPGDDTDAEEDEKKEELEQWIDAKYKFLYTAATQDVVKAVKEGIILTVLNASTDLIEKLETVVKANASSKNAYQTILSGLQQTISNSNDFFVVDKNLVRYHTMTSSMVISNDKKVRPATDGSLRFWETPEKAEVNPYKLYVERLLSKYTVSFINDNNETVILSNQTSTEPTDDPEEILTLAELEEEDDVIFSQRLIYEKPSSPIIRVVQDYTRSESIEKRTEVNPENRAWKINIVGWGVNGLEAKENLFKSININDADLFKDWAESEHFRYLWAEDEHYDTKLNDYPYQCRNLEKYFEDAEGPKFGRYVDASVPALESMTSVPLEYYSFNNLSSRDFLIYTPENTFRATGTQIGNNPVQDKSYFRLNSHLIVTAQLLIDGFDDSDVYKCENFDDGGLVNYFGTGAESKYRMNDIYWSEKAYKDYVIEYLGYWMLTEENQKADKFGPNDGCFYIDENGTLATAKDFQLSRANVKDGDARVWLEPISNVKLYVRNPNYKPEEEVSEEVTDPDDHSGEQEQFSVRGDEPEEGDVETPTEPSVQPEKEYIEINPIIYQKLAYDHPELMAECFIDGKMYYAAATKHYPQGSSMIATGNFGTLRNYWYNFTVERISKPGMPVATDTQRIVPNNLPFQEAMGTSIKVMDWHSISASLDVNGQHRPGEPDDEEENND